MTLMTALSSPDEAAAPVHPATRAVEIVGVGKSFGDVRALHEVSLQLADGEFLAVLGPSGCGKTTLLRCMAGFERIDTGRIALGGRAVALPGIHLPPHRRQVAVVPQEGALFPHLSVAENVGFGLSRRGGRRAHRVEECLELVGLIVTPEADVDLERRFVATWERVAPQLAELPGSGRVRRTSRGTEKEGTYRVAVSGSTAAPAQVAPPL